MQNEKSASGLMLSFVESDDFKKMMQQLVGIIDRSYSDSGPGENKADMLEAIQHLYFNPFRDALVRFAVANDKSRKYCAGDVVQCFTTCPAYDSEHGECSIDMTRDAALDIVTAPLLLCDFVIKYLYDAYREEIEKLPMLSDDNDELVMKDGWDDVVEYCKNDIAATEEAIKALAKDSENE